MSTLRTGSVVRRPLGFLSGIGLMLLTACGPDLSGSPTPTPLPPAGLAPAVATPVIVPAPTGTILDPLVPTPLWTETPPPPASPLPPAVVLPALTPQTPALAGPACIGDPRFQGANTLLCVET